MNATAVTGSDIILRITKNLKRIQKEARIFSSLLKLFQELLQTPVLPRYL
jgi:hypothetical protein